LEEGVSRPKRWVTSGLHVVRQRSLSPKGRGSG
jgi:hypothetical protein